MMPRNIWMPSAMLSVMRWFSRVSQMPSARRVLGVEAVLPAQHAVDLRLRLVAQLRGWPACRRCSAAGVGEHRLEGGGGDGGLVLVGPAVHAHHHLRLHHADDQEGGLVDQHASCPRRPPCRRGPGPARRPARSPAASPARSRSSRKRPPALRDDVAHARRRRGPRRGRGRSRVLVPFVMPAPRRVLAADGHDLRDAGAQQLRVLVGEPDGSARRAGPGRAWWWRPARARRCSRPSRACSCGRSASCPRRRRAACTMESVPQAMASTVSAMRLRLWAASARKSRHTRLSSARVRTVRLMTASAPPPGRAARPGGRGNSRPPGR